MSTVKGHIVELHTLGPCRAKAVEERIRFCVARTDDTVYRDRNVVFIKTDHLGDFINVFYADGFTDRLEVFPCSQS